MRLKVKVVGRANLSVEIPPGKEEAVGSIRARLPCDFDDFLDELGIYDLSEEDFLDRLHSLDVESFVVEPGESIADSSIDERPVPEKGASGRD
jgi:hypothetical protein